MPIERRQQLLKDAEKYDFLIIEDDYESEINFVSEPTPALKSLDNENRVIYVGSLSKTLASHGDSSEPPGACQRSGRPAHRTGANTAR